MTYKLVLAPARYDKQYKTPPDYPALMRGLRAKISVAKSAGKNKEVLRLTTELTKCFVETEDWGKASDSALDQLQLAKKLKDTDLRIESNRILGMISRE